MNALRRGTDACFAVALACAPPAFRREYGAAMRADFLLAFDDERTLHGAVGAATYAAGAIADVVATALREDAALISRDLTFAWRSLRKTPAFTAIVVATLALAIGANAAVFSVLDAVALAPLPYAHADRLVALRSTSQGRPFSFALPDFAEVAARTGGTFADVAAYLGDTLTLTGRGAPRKLGDAVVTAGYFSTLGVAPADGRFFTTADSRAGAAKAVVIGAAFARSAFGEASPVGASLVLDGSHYRVIGVAPAGFHAPGVAGGFFDADVFTPIALDGSGTEYGQRGYHAFAALARLADGVTIDAASAQLDAVTVALRRRHPLEDARTGFDVEALADALVGSVKPLLFATFAAVATVLLVACANVANLLLSRAASREREFSVRIAVGASRGRIVTQLLVETFVLAASGGACGLALAYGAVRAFAAAHPANLPRADAVAVDPATVLYTLAVVTFCTFAAGLVPAFAISQREPATALKSAGRGGDAHRGGRARGALVACEIALTLSLVAGAGLVIRSFVALTSQPLGFDPARVTVIGPIDAPTARYPNDAALAAFLERAERRANAVPGVASAAWSYNVPFGHARIGLTFAIDGRPVKPGTEPDASIDTIGAAYFRTIGATLAAGRPFDERDRSGAARVAIVNEAFVKRFLAGGPALGGRVAPSISSDGEKTPPYRTIVGVVADVRPAFGLAAEPTIYLPVRQVPIGGARLVVRAAPGSDPGPAVAAAVTALDPLLPPPPVRAMAALQAADVATRRFSLIALCALAFVALALSIAGVFAVVSYGVTQRTHEIGVRMALGADGRAIVRMVLGRALRIALIGVGLGLVLAGTGTRFLADQLYDVEPFDPPTFAIVTALVLAAALCAAFVPARRAVRVDPVVALRYD